MKWWANKNPLEAVKSAGLILGILGVPLLYLLLIPLAVIGLMATISPTLGWVGAIGWSVYVLLSTVVSHWERTILYALHVRDTAAFFAVAWLVVVNGLIIWLAFVVLRSCS